MPFSKEYLKKYKEKGIKKITSSSSDYKTIYYFNSLGQLYLEKNFLIKKKKDRERLTALDSVMYKYDTAGNLIVLRAAGHVGRYDSIAYNSSGRVTYYFSYDFYCQKKNKISIDTNYILVLEKSDAFTTTFINKAAAYTSHYVYNTNNEIKKKYDRNSIDSLTRIDIAPGEYSVKYFYKEDTAKYKLGQEFLYKNNKISVCTYYEKLYNNTELGHMTKRYFYNDHGSLILKTTGDHNYGTKEVYFYDYKGYLFQQYVLYDGTIKEFYQYNYSLYE
ncbi:MAG: hypothetical protein Q8L81_15830 [Bacteroidota bacterium]|nr:hypothetical protein [Bacteroidota bacterium]